MITIAKNSLNVLILPLLITNITSFGMELSYPQFQIQEQEKNAVKTIIKAELYLDKAKAMFPGAHYPAKFLFESIAEAGIDVNKIDPCLSIQVKSNGVDWTHSCLNIETTNISSTGEKKSENVPYFPKSIPARHLFGLSTNSILHLTVHGKLVELTCTKNSILNNKEFHEQFDEHMQKLYSKPIHGMMENPERTLYPNDILIPDIQTPWITTALPNGGISRTRRVTYTWGVNGCSDENKLIELIMLAHKKIKSPYTSMFMYVMTRATGQKSLKVLR